MLLAQDGSHSNAAAASHTDGPSPQVCMIFCQGERGFQGYLSLYNMNAVEARQRGGIKGPRPAALGTSGFQHQSFISFCPFALSPPGQLQGCRDPRGDVL